MSTLKPGFFSFTLQLLLLLFLACSAYSGEIRPKAGATFNNTYAVNGDIPVPILIYYLGVVKQQL